MKYIRGDYFLVPNRTALRKLPSRAQVVFICLCSYSDKNGVCFPSANTVSRRTGISRSTVFTALDDLEKSGMIQKTGKKGLVNVYQIMIIDPSQPVQPLDGSCQPVQPLDGGSPTIGRVPVQPLDGNYTQEEQEESNNIIPVEKKRDPVNSVLDIDFFHRVFPSDFVGSKNAYAIPAIRELVAANLVVYTIDEIKRVLSAYEPRMTEPYCPSPGKSVYVFFADNRLSAIRRFVDKIEPPRSRVDMMLHPYKKEAPSKDDDDFGKMVRENIKRREKGLTAYKTPKEMYDDKS